MTQPKLDATWHCWVESLIGFTFSIEYEKGWDNAAAVALSQVTSKLDVETVKSILDRVTVGSTGRADAHNPVVAETDDKKHKQVKEATIQASATHTHVNLHMTGWPLNGKIQYLRHRLIGSPIRKLQNLKHLLADDTNNEEGIAIL